MTEAQRIYLKLSAVGLVAVGILVFSIFWLGGLVSWFIGLLSSITVVNVILTTWSFGKLGRRVRGLDAAEAEAAREAFFKRYPWLRGKRKQANSTLERDARSSL
jgi:biopolymer transport protein ExbB/TolQ